jgi:hypothetical protein
LFATFLASFRSRAALQLEILALRHQLSLLQRSVKRPKLTTGDRFLWAWLSRVWADWRSALVIVKPETVLAWHRQGFRLFWAWKVRRGQPGRPPVSKETRELIRKTSRDHPLRGAPSVHGELLKLGLDVGEAGVGKYMVRRPDVGSQNTSRVGPPLSATCFFSGIQFSDTTRPRTRHTVRNEPTLGVQEGFQFVECRRISSGTKGLRRFDGSCQFGSVSQESSKRIQGAPPAVQDPRSVSRRLYRCMRAEPPWAKARTCSRVAMVVSPGKVVSSAPWAQPSLTASCGGSPARMP